jgi:hypothetical protein
MLPALELACRRCRGGASLAEVVGFGPREKR